MAGSKDEIKVPRELAPDVSETPRFADPELNRWITCQEADKIRGLGDGQLVRLITEIHTEGWPYARCSLCLMDPPDENMTRYHELREQLDIWRHDNV